MLFGSSSLIRLDKSSSQSDEEFKFDSKSQLLIVDKSAKTLKDGKSYEVTHLPSPNNPFTVESYLVSGNKLFRIQGIRPNQNRVSTFIDDILSSPEHILSTFEFDAVFIFISILYLNREKYLTMPSRIVECYGGKPGDYSLNSLQSSVMALWNNNVDNVRTRIEYLCDKMTVPLGQELMLKPNDRKITHLLRFKVNNMCRYAIDNNLFISDYSESSETSSNDTVRKNLVTINEERCRMFCWSILKSYLSEASLEYLLPQDVISSLSKPSKLERPPQIVTKTSKKARPLQMSTGTPSITSFFKKNKM